QARAMNAKPEEMRLKPTVIHCEDAVAARRAPLEIVDDGAEGERPCVEAELRQAGETGGLKQQARTDRPRLGKALEQLNILTIAGEEGRYRQPAGASSDDSDPEVPHVIRPVSKASMRGEIFVGLSCGTRRR